MPIDQDAIYNRRHLNLQPKTDEMMLVELSQCTSSLQLLTLGSKFQKQEIVKIQLYCKSKE